MSSASFLLAHSVPQMLLGHPPPSPDLDHSCLSSMSLVDPENIWGEGIRVTILQVGRQSCTPLVYAGCPKLSLE